MTKKNLILAIFFTSLLGWYFMPVTKSTVSLKTEEILTEVIPETSTFSLKKGDILVRPNWGGLPGSFEIIGGRKYGHVAIVTEDATGKTVDEVLEKASVVEALFFDQATRKFQFSKEKQIRETSASVSFGTRFKGIRYRLRTNLTEERTNKMVRFLRNQLKGGYNIVSLKKRYESDSEKDTVLQSLKDKRWHCATLTWEAFYLVSGIDIDANGGILIYPSDIIASKHFDLPDGRLRF